ncbi:MAG: hypothetical protein L3J67_07695 [Hyphomicrobiaceae bacterium]|nr:hypothetical protein [Hyphomicrobiaceae bacterium]
MLNRLALRLCTVRALRGKTFAGQNVLDSEHGAIDELATEQPKPFIIVYTDDASYSVLRRDLFGTGGSDRVDSGTQKLVIEIGITQRMVIDKDEDGTPIAEAVSLRTNSSMELTLDLIERQVKMALMDTRDEAQWAEMWRRFAIEIKDQDSQRGASARDGLRFAGRQISLSVELPKDPLPGAIGLLWQSFLGLAESDADLAQVVPALRKELSDPGLNDYQAIRGSYGLTKDEAKALQIEPDIGHLSDAPIAQVMREMGVTGIGSDVDPEALS